MLMDELIIFDKYLPIFKKSDWTILEYPVK